MKTLSKCLVLLALSSTTVVASAEIINPGDMFISIAEVGNGSVYKIGQDGSLTEFATGLDSPNGLAFTPDGQLFVVEVGSGEVTNITAGGDFTFAAPHAFGYGFNTIKNLLVDNKGRILLANRSQGTVLDITAGGPPSSAIIFAQGFNGTRDVYQTKSGKIFVVEEYSGEVTDVTGGGDFSSATPYASGFSVPYALAESPDGKLFLTEALSGNVYDISDESVGPVLFASNLDVTDEIIFNLDGAFLAVQEYENTIINISAGGAGPYPVFATGLGMFPQQIAFAPDLSDTDADGVVDGADNCLDEANPDQLDTNNDGFGNACDTDLNNDCITNSLDLVLLRDQFLQTGVSDADFNGDGVVNFTDVARFAEYYLQAPGPSGSTLECVF